MSFQETKRKKNQMSRTKKKQRKESNLLAAASRQISTNSAASTTSSLSQKSSMETSKESSFDSDIIPRCLCYHILRPDLVTCQQWQLISQPVSIVTRSCDLPVMLLDLVTCQSPFRIAIFYFQYFYYSTQPYR